jgi:hypothetical protein
MLVVHNRASLERRLRKLTLRIHPVCIQVWQCRLVTHMLYCLWRFLVQQTTRPPPPPSFLLAHGSVRTARTGGFRARVVGDGARKEDWGRQFGGGRRWNVEGWERSMERDGVETENGGPLTTEELERIWTSSMLLDRIA